jgi:phosphohistidine phosphatase
MLYLIRHADAIDAEPDSARPLSAQGREEARRLAAFLRPGGALIPEEIWHSPLVRARETAAILASALGWTARAQVAAGLEPEDVPGQITRRIESAARPVVIVGHNPHLTHLATLLVTGAPAPAVFFFPKCAVLALAPGPDRRPGGWRVSWMVTPDLLPA